MELNETKDFGKNYVGIYYYTGRTGSVQANENLIVPLLTYLIESGKLYNL